MTKKSMLIVMSNLQNGGAEKSLVNFLNLLDYSRYEVDLLLFQRKGMFLKQVPEQVNILSKPRDLKYCYCSFKEAARAGSGALRWSLLRAVGTGISRGASRQRGCQRQFRWKYFYKPCLENISKKYDIAMAYLHGEPIYYTVDKVTAEYKIGWVHNDYKKSGFSADFDRGYFEKLDKVVTISETCREILENTFEKNKEKFMVLPNLTSAVTIQRMADEFIPPEYPAQGMILVSIGRLVPQKGFDIALEAAAALKKQGVQFQWFFLGDGPLRQELEEMAGKLEIDAQCHFIGSKENPYPYMKHADIVVQSSRFEGKSMVLDEAKILAKPIISTNYTTVIDQMSESEGMIVEMSPQAVAEGIIAMKASELCQSYSSFLKKNHYGNEEQIELYYRLFEKAGMNRRQRES